MLLCLFLFGVEMHTLGRLARQDKLAVRFGAGFVGFGVLFYALYSVLASLGDLGLLKAATAAPVGFVLSLVSRGGVTRADDLIVLGTFRMQIIHECTGVFLMMIFAACVLAYPAGWKAKTLGLAAGVPIIWVANILRLVLVALVGRYLPSYFDYFHDYFWYGTFSLIVIFMWVLWLEKVVERGR